MMDWIKKYLVFALCLAAAFVLLLAVGARLFFVYKSYQKEKRELSGIGGRLDQLYNRDPFPSAANVALAKTRLDDLIDEYNELYGLLSSGQIRPAAMDAYAFNVYLEKKLQSIKNKLAAGRVVFSDKDAFGFDKYTSGNLPNSRDVPRLVQQLQMMEQVCNVLPEAGVSELSSFMRDQFDASAAAEASPAGRQRSPRQPAGSAPAAEESLCSSQHFKMAFRAKEGAVVDFLNRLARLPMFIVVTCVEIKNPRLDTSLGALPAKPAVTNAPAEQTELSREQRIVMGREELDVSLEMDVYNFGTPTDYLKGKLKI